MQALLSVHERRSLRERVQRGYEHRRKRLAAGSRPPWGYIIINDKYELNQAPCICLLIDRPENYLELYNEPDQSNKLPYRSKADIAKEAIQKFIELKSHRQVLHYLYEKYKVPIKKNNKNSRKSESIQQRNKKEPTLEPSIADELLFWSSPEGFRNWIANPVLKGDTAYLKAKGRKGKKAPSEWEIHSQTHPSHRLISDEEAYYITEILKSNTKKVPRTNAIFYLTKHIFCQNCGISCVLKRGSGYAYYGCPYSRAVCDNNKNIRLKKIEQAIILALVDRANQLALEVNESIESTAKSVKVTELEEQLAHLQSSPKADESPILREAITKINRELEELSSKSESAFPMFATVQHILRHPVARKINFWHTLTQKERETFYDKLVGTVLIRDGEVMSVELQV